MRNTFFSILILGLAVPFTTLSGAKGAIQMSEIQTPEELGVVSLSCEHQTNPMGIDYKKPRFSWKISGNRRGIRQTAYQVQVALESASLAVGESLSWDSGKVESDRSILVEYQGPLLQSSQRYHWRVKVWDQDGKVSDWSQPAFFEMGLLSEEDWKASWIQPVLEENTNEPQPAQILRTEFQVTGTVKRARAYATSLGVYEMELNGKKVGDQVLTPGWTSYKHRLQYQTYDVTEMLNQGENALGVTLGDGWYRGYIGFQGQRNYYGENLALLLQIQIEFSDGKTQLVITDGSWKASTGPIRMSDIYDGEVYDARLEKNGWSSPGYIDSDWSNVRQVDHRKDFLVAPLGPPIRKIEEIYPVRILRTPKGEAVYDMGQNMVGWVRLKTEGPKGTEITLRHAEVLDKDGNFYTENLRSADQTIRYILKGEGQETYEPHFTFQGFRYVQVEGMVQEPKLDHITGIVVHSDMEETGEFECSDPLINQLQHNIVWGQKGNFLDVPTDCPQRDERLGWTGDAQVFARTATFNKNVAGFFSKWLKDLAADQHEDGTIPHVIPDVIGGGAAAGWADAGVIIPWTMFQVYGDPKFLQEQYASMKAWVDYIQNAAGENYLWNKGFHFGDWLAFATDRSDYPGATTDKDLIATGFFAYSTSLLARSAEILGYQEDAEYYSMLLGRIKSAFNSEFVTPNGRLSSNTQTAYALALNFDLLPEELRQQAADRLAQNIQDHENHLSTGFLGTPYLCHVLSRFGHLSIAYTLLNQKTYPSWLYPVTQGATTIWERWDGQRPDGSFQDKGMNSFNHYAYGAIGEWLYRVVAGIEIDPENPGYKHFLIQPRPGGGLTSVKASFESPYGRILSNWNLEGTYFSLVAEVPANTSATIRLPNAKRNSVLERGRNLEPGQGIRSLEENDEGLAVEVGSGVYQFEWDAPELAAFIRAGEKLSTHTKIGILMGNERAVEILRRLLPGLLENPAIENLKAFSIRQMSQFAPDQLTSDRLDSVDKELQTIESQ